MSRPLEKPRTGFLVTFESAKEPVWSLPGETILDCARRAGVRVSSVCGGRGLCKSCVIRIKEGPAEKASPEDVEFFSPAEINDNWRRACRTFPVGNCTVEVSARAGAAPLRTQIRSEDVWVHPDPAVRLCPITVAEASLKHPVADDHRLMRALNEKWPGAGTRIDVEVLRALPSLMRTPGGQLEAAVRFGEVVGVLLPEKKPFLGLAIDLGTTNIAGLLVDLRTGRTLQSEGIENPQATYGADVITRIGHARSSAETLRDLRDLAVGGINGLARTLCAARSLTTDRIAEIVVVGNTAMHHLFLGLPVKNLGAVPFVPVASSPLDVKARDTGLEAMPGAYVHLLPNIAGFVGADHTAVLLAIDCEHERRTIVVLDIGTNTEISLLHQGKLTSLSCPSGPALAGGHIRCGMRSAPGAIAAVTITGEEVHFETIDGALPVGICGSGVLDVTAQLYLAGIVNSGGRMRADHPRVRSRNGQRQFVLADKSQTHGRSVVFTQHDIRAVQLAKGAIRAAIDVLLHDAGLETQQIDQIIIAGAFGAYIDLPNSIAIGMLPDVPLDRIAQVGNAAGIGAKLALVSHPHRVTAQSIAAGSRYIEMSGLAAFNTAFMKSIAFPNSKNN